MRIISKFFDYYDKAVPPQYDDDLVYVRETKEFNIPYGKKSNELFSLLEMMPRFPNYSFISSGIIAFCGKIYPYYFCQDKYYYSVLSLKEALPKLMESAEGYDLSFLKELNSFLNPTIKKSRYWRSYLNKEYDEIIGKTISDDLFREHNSPIISAKRFWDHQLLIINDRLNQYHFMSQVDPYTAYQEISMFIGNNLVKQIDPSVNFSDELKRDIHGFDKWSFRKIKP